MWHFGQKSRGYHRPPWKRQRGDQQSCSEFVRLRECAEASESEARETGALAAERVAAAATWVAHQERLEVVEARVAPKVVRVVRAVLALAVAVTAAEAVVRVAVKGPAGVKVAVRVAIGMTIGRSSICYSNYDCGGDGSVHNTVGCW